MLSYLRVIVKQKYEIDDLPTGDRQYILHCYHRGRRYRDSTTYAYADGKSTPMPSGRMEKESSRSRGRVPARDLWMMVYCRRTCPATRHAVEASWGPCHP